MSDWRDTTLGEFIAIQRGHDLTAEERKPGEVPVMGSAGINGYHDTALAKGPGVVIGRSGASFGQVHYSPVAYWPHNTILYVTDFKGNDPLFAYYLLKSIDFSGYNSGSAQPSLNRNHLYQIPLRVPPPAEQRAIARVLGDIDAKIELNRRMNTTLEAMAQALFKAWFVDFEPVRAKAKGRVPDDLAPATAALFPDRLVGSDLGEIPVGWATGTMGDLASLGRESVNPGSYPEEVFAHYSLPACDEGRLPRFETGESILSQKLLVPDDCVLLSKLNPRFPRCWLPFPPSTHRSIASTEFLALQPKPGFTRAYLYGVCTSEPFNQTFATLVTGTSGSHQRVQPASLISLPVMLPPADLVAAFTEKALTFYEKIEALRQESRQLSVLSDELLPRLLSGALQVPELANATA